MDQITITREEFKERIINNPKGYGLVRAMRKDPEKAKGHKLMSAVEEITTRLILSEIEEELFGPENEPLRAGE